MSSRLIEVLDKFGHDMAIAELQRLYKDRDESDLSYHDTLYLNIIQAHPNRYTSSQIADLLKISRPAITQKINELVKKGYIIRTQSDTDKRLFYLSINTEKSYYTKEDREIELHVSKMLNEKFGCEDVERMCEMLIYLSDEIFNKKIKEFEINSK